jgi:hypothetical protein
MNGGYRFFNSGDKQGGVWTENERRAEAARQQAAQAAADARAQLSPEEIAQKTQRELLEFVRNMKGVK